VYLFPADADRDAPTVIEEEEEEEVKEVEATEEAPDGILSCLNYLPKISSVYIHKLERD